MDIDNNTLSQFASFLHQRDPDLRIMVKDKSWFQKAIAYVLQPFNQRYMLGYVSTFGSSIYFPTQEIYDKHPVKSFYKLAHEYVHITDSKRDPLYRLKYLFPQILVVIPIVLYAYLAGTAAWILALPVLGYLASLIFCKRSKALFWIALGLSLVGTLVLGWMLTKWSILVLLGFVVVGPWPAPWRVNYELRGFGMEVALEQWLYGSLDEKNRSIIIEQFVGPSYLYMSRDRAYITRSLEATRQQAQVGALQRDPPYGEVFDFLYARRLIRR